MLVIGSSIVHPLVTARYESVPGASRLEHCAGVILAPASQEEGLEWLRSIRALPSTKAYLSPVFCVLPAVGNWPLLSAAVDGAAPLTPAGGDLVAQWKTSASALRSRVSALRGEVDGTLMVRVLRMAYTRGWDVVPQRNGLARLGYDYPALSIFTETEVVSVLDLLLEERLLEGQFVDKVHLCRGCKSSRLNFREICPSCQSPDLEVEDVLHHFRCAYMGPASDFGPPEHKTCPKCGSGVHQVGVDYDVPSSIAVCNHCGDSTQEPDTQTLCLDCGSVVHPVNLDLAVIRRYRLTAAGETAALHGMESLLRTHLSRELTILPHDVFDRILRLEEDRIRRYGKSESCLLTVHLGEPGELDQALGAKAPKAYAEVGHAVAALLRKPDLVRLDGESAITLLLPETPLAGATALSRRLVETLNDVLSSSLGIPADVSVSAREII